MVMSRGAAWMTLVLSATGAALGGAAEAQEVRYFVLQSTGLFEITGEATGGLFVISAEGEHIDIPGIGVRPVQGRTDRAQSGETVVTQLRGNGLAQVRVTYTMDTGRRKKIFSGNLPIPLVDPTMVTVDADFDSVVVTVTQNGTPTSRRLPIGTRP
jgi:hypothetical protein